MKLKFAFASAAPQYMLRFYRQSKYFPARPRLENATDLEKTTVKNIILQEYTLAKTGIHFVGFGDCDTESNSDVYIHFGVSRDRAPIGAAEIGQDMDWLGGVYRTDASNHDTMAMSVYERKPGIGPSYVYIEKYKHMVETVSSKLPEKEYLELAALHEFGHAAGLGHEDDRVEANDSPFCTLSRQGRTRAGMVGAAFTSPYDHYSCDVLLFYEFCSRLYGFKL